jgi:Dna[CI] antecedent, DciA
VVEARSGAWGAQLQFLSEDIRRRANETLGGDAVERVRVVVVSGSE